MSITWDENKPTMEHRYTKMKVLGDYNDKSWKAYIEYIKGIHAIGDK